MMKNRIGYLYPVTTTPIWGSVYIVNKYALETMEPVTVLCVRYVVAGAALCILLKVRKTRCPIERGHWRYIWIVGGLGYLVPITYRLMGTKLLDASLASPTNGMNPITISLLAAIFLKEKIQKKHIVSICISIVGVHIILGTRGGSISMAGALAPVCSVLLRPTASVAIREVSDGYDSVQIALYGLGIAPIFTVLAAIVESMGWPPVTNRIAVPSCIYLGVVGIAVAHTLRGMAPKLLDASMCSMFYPLQPLTSSIPGVPFLHEVPTWNFVVGGVLIRVGVVVSVVEKRTALKG